MKIKTFTLTLISCLLLTACGGSDSEPSACNALKIANGETCESKSIPVVLLKLKSKNGDSVCSGTIITRTSILTAAHCVKGMTAIEVVHRKGAVNISEGYYNGYYSYTSTYGLSPYDVAILKVPEGFTESVGIASTPLGLASNIYHGEKLTTFGFGRDENNQISYNLPKAANVIFNEVSEDHIITYAYDGYTKGGDSGGPLVHKGAIVGVTTGMITLFPEFNFFANVRNQANYSFIMSLASDVATKSSIKRSVDDGLAVKWEPTE